MHNYYPTTDIKLASCLLGFGVPYRRQDPVTKVIQDRGGKPFEQFTFWMDISDDEKKKQCGTIADAYYKARDSYEYVLGEDHPLYWMMGVLLNREALLHWMRADAEPMKILQCGNKTILISSRASQATKDKVKSQL